MQCFSQVQVKKNIEVITGTLIRTTKPLKNLTAEDLNYPYVQVRNENGRIWPEGKKPAPFTPVKYPEQQQSIDPSLHMNSEKLRATGRYTSSQPIRRIILTGGCREYVMISMAI
jgi:hypothetical protein